MRQMMSCERCVDSSAGGKQRPNDQTRGLHGEDQRHHHATVVSCPQYSLMMVALTG